MTIVIPRLNQLAAAPKSILRVIDITSFGKE
jgi:hypothetical protein